MCATARYHEYQAFANSWKAPVEHQSHQCDEGKVTQAVTKDHRACRRRPGSSGNEQGREHVPAQRDRQRAQGSSADERPAIEHCDRDAGNEEQIDRSRYLARLQRCERQGRVGDELSLWHQDHAGDGVDDDECESEQRIDRPIGDGILSATGRSRGSSAISSAATHAVSTCTRTPARLSSPSDRSSCCRCRGSRPRCGRFPRP